MFTAPDTALAALMEPVQAIAREAGHRILAVYANGFSVTEKADQSPVTEADLAAHRCILRGLAQLTPGIPILSEEAADVSFAIGAGSDAAIEAADVTLVRSDLNGIADAILLSRATLRKIRQNLFCAFFYNVLGIPLAALGMLSPVIAGAAMAMSSVSVVSNSLLLKRWRVGKR